MIKKLCRPILILLALMGMFQVTAAEEYRIGAGDILEIRFWQDVNLNTSVRVNEDGMIALDIVGRLKAAGKTSNELQDEIVRQLSRLDAPISQAVVRVINYNYQYVYVKGQVNNPGKQSYEFIPDLWHIINEAGGVTNIGDLTRVTIIRGGDRAGEVEIVDVLDAIGKGEMDKLPKLSRQDTIEIPATPFGVPSEDLVQQMARKNFIYVIGAVARPGQIKFEENVDVLDAISLAGGPLPNADLKHTQIITKDGYFAQTLEVDLNRYTSQGKPNRYILKKEDTIFLPTKKENFMKSGLGTIAAVAGVITSGILIYNQVK